MSVILDGYIWVPYQELETIKNEINEHIEYNFNKIVFLNLRYKSKGLTG